MSKLQQQLRQSRPFGSLAIETFLNLLRTAERFATEEAMLLRKSDLSPPQYNVLRILRGAGTDGHPCQEIGARMLTRVPDVTRLVDRLEQAGLVERSRGDSDRRIVRVRIKKAGLDLLAELDAPAAALPTKLFAPLTAKELQSLNDLLEKARGDR